MRLAGDAVDEHARQTHGRIEIAIAERHRADAARGPGSVDDQQHRRRQELRDLGGAAAVAVVADAVVEAHHAFDDGDVGIRGGADEQITHPLRRHQPGVEVAARPTGGEGVMGRIDEVGADLVRLDDESATAQRDDEAERDRRLADAAVRAGDHDAGRHDVPPGNRAALADRQRQRLRGDLPERHALGLESRGQLAGPAARHEAVVRVDDESRHSGQAPGDVQRLLARIAGRGRQAARSPCRR